MATKEPTQAETNSKNMRAVYNGIESGDMSVMDQFVADDIVDHDGPRGPLKGRDSVKKMLADMHNHIANLKFDMIAEATGGDYHFALTRISGKTKDGMMGMPPNTEMSDTSISMVKVVNGKVVEHWDFERHHYMPAGHNKMGKTK
jgi:predicted ester cyclase